MTDPELRDAASACVAAWIDAMHRADHEAARLLLSPDVVFRFDAPAPLGGERVGADGVFGFYRQLAETAGTPTGGAILDVLGGDRYALEVYEREVAVGSDTRAARVAVLHEVRDGHIVAIDFLPIDRSEFEAMVGDAG